VQIATAAEGHLREVHIYARANVPAGAGPLLPAPVSIAEEIAEDVRKVTEDLLVR
jgi:hypothetical protein